MNQIFLYSEIAEGAAEQFIRELRGTTDVTVRINSPGGVVSEGIAIYNALKAHTGTVTTIVDGLAASIASLIAMAGKRVLMAQNAMLMVHDPHVIAQGNSADLTRTAGTLDKVASTMVAAYQRSGLSAEKVREAMRAETWFTADEALSAGFIDEVTEGLAIAASFDLSKFTNVPPKVIAMTTPNPQAAATETAFLARETARRGDIRASFTNFKESQRELLDECLDDASCTADQARAKLLTALGTGLEPIAGPGSLVHLEQNQSPRADNFFAAASEAICIRGGVKIEKPVAGATDLANLSIVEIARACLSKIGKSGARTMPAPQVIRAALSTSDFPGILGESVNKSLRRGYANEPATYLAWVRESTVTDFKTQNRALLGSAPSLLRVNEGAEYKEGSLIDDIASFAPIKYGRIVSITWEALVNDDLSALTTMPKAMGQAARRTEADVIYALLAANSGAGQTMQDSTNLFTVGHNNLLSSGAALSVTTLGAMRMTLRKQTALGGGYLGLVPKVLLIPPELEAVAEQLVVSSTLTTNSGNNTQFATPQWISQLQIVVEPRLPATVAYLIADPNQVDVLELAHLASENGPVTEEDEDFNTDVRRFKVRDVFAAKFLDWRGIVKQVIA